MITFQEIHEVAQKERYSEQLQPIAKNFIREVAKYLKEKKEIASKEDDIFSDIIVKTKKQLETATTFFKEIIRRRKKKILNLVLIATETGISKRDFDNMLEFEKTLFENLMKCMDSSDKVLKDVLKGGKEEQKQKNQLVVFKESVEKFVGFNGEPVGPFEKDQIVNLPKEIAKILIEGGQCEIVEK